MCEPPSTIGSFNRDRAKITRNAIGTSGVRESLAQMASEVRRITGGLFSKVKTRLDWRDELIG